MKLHVPTPIQSGRGLPHSKNWRPFAAASNSSHRLETLSLKLCRKLCRSFRGATDHFRQSFRQSRSHDTSVQRHRAAFTLIELVISAALMSIILVSGYLCLRAVVEGQKMIDTRADIAQNGRVAMALMTADLRAATPLSEEFEFLGMPRLIGSMQADNLDFATHNYTPRRPSEGDWSEVSYFLDKNPRTGRFSLWRRRDPTRDPEPLSGGSREEIAEGVRGLKFEYYDGYDWYDEWGDAEGRPQSERALLLAGNLSGMPEAVRITLWLDANSPPKDDASEEEPESPLVFQTIVRLNLAGREWESSSTSSTTAEAPQSGPAPGGRN